jgi:Outer membrane protein TOM13
MSQESPPSSPQDLSASGLTIPSDSEAYSSLSPPSSSPPQSSSNNHGEGSPVILYQPPTVWSILRGAAINLLLPFINGMMLGFGELLAHEFAFRLGWGGTNVSYRISPYVQMRNLGNVVLLSREAARSTANAGSYLSRRLGCRDYVSWINPLLI